jgi:hypothetical protein
MIVSKKMALMRFFAATIGFCAAAFARMIPMVTFPYSSNPGDESPYLFSG